MKSLTESGPAYQSRIAVQQDGCEGSSLSFKSGQNIDPPSRLDCALTHRIRLPCRWLHMGGGDH